MACFVFSLPILSSRHALHTYRHWKTEYVRWEFEREEGKYVLDDNSLTDCSDWKFHKLKGTRENFSTRCDFPSRNFSMNILLFAARKCYVRLFSLISRFLYSWKCKLNCFFHVTAHCLQYGRIYAAPNWVVRKKTTQACAGI